MKIDFGCAPINWSNNFLASLGGELTYQQCLSEMALAGYTGSEGGYKFPREKATMKKALELRGLRLCNMWFGTSFTSFENEKTYAAFDQHLDYTYALGARVVGVGEIGTAIHSDQDIPLFSHHPMLSEAQFENLVQGLNELGYRAKAKGMQLCFHPHLGTGIQTREEIDQLMDATDPNLVYLLLDTGHQLVAGADPILILKKYMNRIRHIHAKDVRRPVFEQLKREDWSFLQGVQHGLFTVPGDGDLVHWSELFSILKASDYSGWIVVEADQDPSAADPLEYAIKARKFLRLQVGY
jgi:inosose dehydratase